MMQTTSTSTSTSTTLPLRTGAAAGQQQPQQRGDGAPYNSVREACSYMRVGRTTLYKLARAGHIRMQKIGSRTVVEMDSVRTMLAEAPAASLRPIRR